MRKRRRGVGARGDGGDAIARRAAAGDTSGVMAGTRNPFCFNQLDSPSESELFSALSQEAFFSFLFFFLLIEALNTFSTFPSVKNTFFAF